MTDKKRHVLKKIKGMTNYEFASFMSQNEKALIRLLNIDEICKFCIYNSKPECGRCRDGISKRLRQKSFNDPSVSNRGYITRVILSQGDCEFEKFYNRLSKEFKDDI